MTGRWRVAPEVVARVLRAVEAAGLKPDMSADRVGRAVRETAAARGLDRWPAVDGPGVVAEVVERLTVQESWFFRDPKQLTAVARHLFPQLTPPIELWCAGCANGQEAWTAAMLLADYADGPWQVIATDLSSRAVARAAAGEYGESELRGLSADLRARHLARVADGLWRITAPLRERVTFLTHNIAVDPPPAQDGAVSMVWCRNVMIYLTDVGVQSALTAVERALTPDGWLVVGGAESLWALTDRFQAVRLPGAFAYSKAASGRRPAAPSRPPGAHAPLPAPLPDPADLVAQGTQAAAAGDHHSAAVAFRQAAYLDPDRAEAHTGLSIALDALGEPRAAARARAAAQAASKAARGRERPT